ncbi:MAG TPA: hypothetical protein VLE69_00920 [Candidatus Saccharimonadales bacterium]|nr:hypothetical protein [Candidatus Saccharimonadales bacterium]
MMQSKQAKTPPLSDKTKILCFDLEANGLHGEVFAIGAVVMDATDNILDQFTGRTGIVGPVDSWVEKNVVPAIKDMPSTHKTYKDLREDFWKWFLRAQETSDYVLVSNGYPVEYRFLLKCQEENLDERYWQHPFPILDLFSLLVLANDMPDKSTLVRELTELHNLSRHNPLDDAKKSALIAFRALQVSDKI